MKEAIEKILADMEAFKAAQADDVDRFRTEFLAKKGRINALFADFRNVPPEQKKDIGQALNSLRNKAEEQLEALRSGFSDGSSKEKWEDITRSSGATLPGSVHPVEAVLNEISDIFARIGFAVADGPEIEDDWHNFSALNFPPEHPARDMQDTFFVQSDDDPLVLRTHTSSVQVRLMEHQEPPIRAIMPGRVFRNEAISARSHCIFHQVEGLYIDKDVSFADLKQTLLYFAREMFGENREIRLRPSYFPFTEPSAEVDVYWGLENETDYRITKGTGWLEIMGCGMVHPNVLKNNGIDPNEYSGYAFGMGIERIVMLRYQIGDIRDFFENDIRFLDQFRSVI